MEGKKIQQQGSEQSCPGKFLQVGSQSPWGVQDRPTEEKGLCHLPENKVKAETSWLPEQQCGGQSGQQDTHVLGNPGNE